MNTKKLCRNAQLCYIGLEEGRMKKINEIRGSMVAEEGLEPRISRITRCNHSTQNGVARKLLSLPGKIKSIAYWPDRIYDNASGWKHNGAANRNQRQGAVTTLSAPNETE